MVPVCKKRQSWTGLFFYLFLAFRDRYIQVKGGIKWHLKVPENIQKGTKRGTFAQINRLASEFESCIVHHKNHTEKCGSFLYPENHSLDEWFKRA